MITKPNGAREVSTATRGVIASRRWGVAWTLSVILMLLAGGDASALTDEEVFRGFQFNFINPGARALGLGGAYIAAADDATAAEANPAALHYVKRQELFGEYRSVSQEKQVFDVTSVMGDIGDPAAPEFPFVDLSTQTVQEDQSFPSFFSYALPFTIRKARFTFAASRTTILDVTTNVQDPGTSLDFAFEGFPVWINPNAEPGDNPVQQYAVQNASAGGLDATIFNNNVSFSGSVGNFSFGITAAQANLDIENHGLKVFIWDTGPNLMDRVLAAPHGAIIWSGLLTTATRAMIEVFPSNQAETEEYRRIRETFFA